MYTYMYVCKYGGGGGGEYEKEGYEKKNTPQGEGQGGRRIKTMREREGMRNECESRVDDEKLSFFFRVQLCMYITTYMVNIH